MISVLIPAYNEDPTNLCLGLLKEGRSIEGFEILVGDDHSFKNIPVPDPHIDPIIRVIRNPENLGYNKNRNNLAEEAKNEKLLFLDADVDPVSEKFLENYLSFSNEHPGTFICGGIQYGKQPDDPALLLKWKHGKEREEIPFGKRNNHPGRSFSAANFLCLKSIYLKYPFSSSGKLYGYNDTLYGLKLESNGEQIQHVNNPVLHEGLMNAEDFLSRAKDASKNLIEFENDPKYQNLLSEIRLFKTHKRLKGFGLAVPATLTLKALRPMMLRNLKSGSPNLKYYDLYRLSLLLELRP